MRSEVLGEIWPRVGTSAVFVVERIFSVDCQESPATFENHSSSQLLLMN